MDASTIACIIVYLTNNPQAVRLRSGVLKKVVIGTGSTTGDCTLKVSFHSAHRLPAQLSPVASRHTQMALLLLGVPVMEKRLSTGSWSITLRRRVRIISFSKCKQDKGDQE